VVRTWRYDLDKLYNCKKGLKIELESLFNFPLGLSEFERVWKEMEEKYVIQEHPSIKYLYAKREMWIMAYFKGLCCGRMTSTQWSESTNMVLKDGFVNNVHCISLQRRCWKCYIIWIILMLRRVTVLRYELGFKSLQYSMVC
jgi:hypothetical protein